jgi:hypothetical protein
MKTLTRARSFKSASLGVLATSLQPSAVWILDREAS